MKIDKYINNRTSFLITMNKNKPIILFIVFCSLCFLLVAETDIQADQAQQKQIHSYIRHGIEKAFNLEMKDAVVSLQKAVELDRENPIGYSFLALTYLFSYEVSYNQQIREKNQELMHQSINNAISRGEKKIAVNAGDTQAYYAMALARIAKVRWAIMQKKSIMVADETSVIWDHLSRVKKNDPNNIDIYFAIGLLHYHLDHLQGLTRIFSSLLITPGDRQKGIKELELAAKKGDLLKELAQAELAAIYSNYEQKPNQALPIVRELKRRFPLNYNFTFALANIVADLHQFEEAFALARIIESNIQAKKAPYEPLLWSRYYLLMGRILFNQGEYDKAMQFLQLTLKDKSSFNARILAWSYVRMGMISDIRKERTSARDYYNKALNVEGGEGAAQAEAKKYLATPYIKPHKP